MKRKFLHSIWKCLWLILVATGSCLPLNARGFVHPGIALTTTDLATVKANLTKEPWASGYAALQADEHSSLNYTMQGPFVTVSRNPDQNRSQWENDMQAVYNLSCMWYFTGNTNYAQKAHDILLAWATTQRNFWGVEGSFELGDYAYRYAGGADILRGTWPGWTSSDTTTVQNYFAQVYWPAVGVPGPVMTGSQGIEQMQAAVAIAVFNDDTTKFNQALSAFLSDADSGLRATSSNGEPCDMGRDQGHTALYVLNSAWIGEVFWKQGVDVFSLLDNRILALGEYYSRYNITGIAPAFVPLGGPFWGVFPNISGGPRTSTQPRLALNILHGAYAVRKGLTLPWVEQYRRDQSEDAMSFLYRKSGDTSTAVAAMLPNPPSTASLTTGLASADLNGCSPAGSTNYSNGRWTLVSGYNGIDPWGTTGNDTVRFAYKQITGDFTMLAQVTSVANVGSLGAKAGIMVRDTLNSATNRCWIAMTPGLTYERALLGWTSLSYGSNSQARSFSITQMPYWVKLERVGLRIQTFTSINGSDWSPAATADFANLPSTLYVGLFGTSLVNGTASTATFANVRLTGADGGEAVKTPPAPFTVFASPGDGRVPLRWNEAFGATKYNVKRSTASGGPFTTLASVSNTTFTDTTVRNGTTYFYVVTATNSAGESGNSLPDSATPQSSTVNVAVGGTATASASNPSGNEGPQQAFDSNPGSKWFSFNGGPASWIQYDLGPTFAQKITSYAVTSANDVPARDPRNWKFQASNDGTNWTTLDTQSNQAFTYRLQTLTYSINNINAYRYYRLNITGNNGDPWGVQLSELALLTDRGHTLPNGTYRLLSRHSNKAFDASGGGTANGTPLIQSTYGGSSNQRWTFTDQGNGQYQILGVGSGKAVDVNGGSTADSARVQLWTWNGGNHQKWTVTPTGDGFFRLTSVNSSKVADVSGGSNADGSAIIQWPYTGGLNQQWSVTAAP